MQIETWIPEENLMRVLDAIGWLCRNDIDPDDRLAIEEGMRHVDEIEGKWFEYAFAGEGRIDLSISMERGTGSWTLRLKSDLDIGQGANTAILMAQTFVIGRRI